MKKGLQFFPWYNISSKCSSGHLNWSFDKSSTNFSKKSEAFSIKIQNILSKVREWKKEVAFTSTIDIFSKTFARTRRMDFWQSCCFFCWIQICLSSKRWKKQLFLSKLIVFQTSFRETNTDCSFYNFCWTFLVEVPNFFAQSSKSMKVVKRLLKKPFFFQMFIWTRKREFGISSEEILESSDLFWSKSQTDLKSLRVFHKKCFSSIFFLVSYYC